MPRAARVLLACLALGASACGRGEGTPPSEKPRPGAPAATTGLVVIPPDSPQLRQIRVESVNVGNVTTYAITNLVIGTTYYFAVSAFNSSGIESGFSNEVSKSIY